MKKSLVIISVSLMLVGIIILTCALAVCGFDFRKLSTVEYKDSSFSFDEKVENISVNVFTSNILLLASSDDTVKVELHEYVKEPHAVTVSEGVLRIESEDQREWTDYVGINFDSPKIKIYLPESQYKNLSIENFTGDIEVSSDLSFKDVKVKNVTGDMRFFAESSGDITIDLTSGDVFISGSTLGNINVTQTTGDIEISGVSCTNLDIENTTGDIDLDYVTAQEDMNLKTTTGSIEFELSDAENIYMETTTGDIEGSLCSEKIFDVEVNTGDIEIPRTSKGGRCKVITNTGDVEIEIK